jgi:hypothetical protein
LVAELRNGTNCRFVDVEENKARLRVSTTRLDRAFSQNATTTLFRNEDDPRPLDSFWPSFYGLWPPPERSAERPEQPTNPLWWWRTLLYGRSKKFIKHNEQLLADERRKIDETRREI